MEFKEFTAGADDNDRRLDRVIRKIAEKENLSGLYKALRKGLIRLNGKKTDVSEHVFEGDKIRIPDFLLKKEDENSFLANSQKSELKNGPEKTKADFQIIFQNEDFLFINKPYDIPVHGASNSLEKTVVDFYRNNFPQKKSISFTPGPVHRLDRKTTGILAFSMSLTGARWFSENIANHSIKKIYTAVVQGKVLEPQCWTDYISKEYSESKAFQTVKIYAGDEIQENSAAQKKSLLAKTKIFPVKYFEYKKNPCTLVNIEIDTGRTHQIRSQAAFHGFPLLGDTAYGGTKISAEQDFFLHAKTLVFPEERLPGLPEKFEANLPFAFEKFCKTDLLNI